MSALLALCLVLGLVAGCSGSGDSPTVLPPASTTPSASASTAPAPDPKAAAVAVVREYFRLLNNLSRDMNAEGFASLETNSCPCRKFLRSVRGIRAKHQYYFGHATITSVTATIDSRTKVEVLVSYNSSAAGIRGRDGSIVSQSPGLVGATENFYIELTSGHWLVGSILAVRAGRQR